MNDKNNMWFHCKKEGIWELLKWIMRPTSLKSFYRIQGYLRSNMNTLWFTRMRGGISSFSSNTHVRVPFDLLQQLWWAENHRVESIMDRKFKLTQINAIMTKYSRIKIFNCLQMAMEPK